MQKFTYKILGIATLSIMVLITGCSKTSPTTPPNKVKEVQQEDKDTQAMKERINKLNSQVEAIANISFQEQYQAYEQQWANIQAHYDFLKKAASVQPYDEATIANIKNNLLTIQEDVSAIQNVNEDVDKKIKNLKVKINETPILINKLNEQWGVYKQIKVKQITEKDIKQLAQKASQRLEEAQGKIQDAENLVRIQNGRANGLFNSAKKYVESLR